MCLICRLVDLLNKQCEPPFTTVIRQQVRNLTTFPLVFTALYSVLRLPAFSQHEGMLKNMQTFRLSR